MSEDLCSKLGNVDSSQLLALVAARDLLSNTDWKPVHGNKFEAAMIFPTKIAGVSEDGKVRNHVKDMLRAAGGYVDIGVGTTPKYLITSEVKDKLERNLSLVHDTATKSRAVS